MTKSTLKISTLAFVALALTACTGGNNELRKTPNNDLIQDMMESPAIKPQDFDTFDRTKSASRLPPEGTVKMGGEVYPYHLKPEEAEQKLKNPIGGVMSAEVIELGRTKYETYCAVCHGYTGAGDGPVSVKMAIKPPSLIVAKAIAYNDGRLFHIITDGQGVMSSYAYQLVDPRDRWAIVNYVRSLQKLAGKETK